MSEVVFPGEGNVRCTFCGERETGEMAEVYNVDIDNSWAYCHVSCIPAGYEIA